MVTMVLRAGSPYMQLGHLKELARLTGVIARSSYQGQWCAWSLLTAVTNFPSSKCQLVYHTLPPSLLKWLFRKSGCVPYKMILTCICLRAGCLLVKVAQLHTRPCDVAT